MWDHFKISPQPNILTLVEAIRVIYSSDLVLIPSPDIKMAIDVLEAEEITFTLVTNKKYKRKIKVFSLSSMSFFNSRNKTSLISQALFLLHSNPATSVPTYR